MKKSNWFKAAYAIAALLFLACCFASRVQAQCIPAVAADPGFSYTLLDAEDGTRIRFSLDYDAPDGMGAYGFQLTVQLPSDMPMVSVVTHHLGGSWLFANATVSTDVDYDAVTRRATFEVLRTDCKGAVGSGFVGELRIYHGTGGTVEVLSVTETIVMVDNVDAGT